jgi:hypothetical protein
MAEGDFATFVARTLAESIPATDTLVPRTHFWGVADDSFVGRISIHHSLNEALPRARGLGRNHHGRWRRGSGSSGRNLT